MQKDVQKQVIVLVSHHKAIKHLIKFASKHTGTKIEKVFSPDYCFSMKFTFDSTPTDEENFTLRKF